jgi:hypothetical protein
MKNEEMADIVCRTSAALDMHPLLVLNVLARLAQPDEQLARDRFIRDVHLAIFEIRATIPWRIVAPNDQLHLTGKTDAGK